MAWKRSSADSWPGSQPDGSGWGRGGRAAQQTHKLEEGEGNVFRNSQLVGCKVAGLAILSSVQAAGWELQTSSATAGLFDQHLQYYF